VNVRRTVVAAVLLLGAPVLSSCGVNFDAQTDQPYNPAVGVDDRSSAVDVLNALIVSGDNGSGTLVASLVNNDTRQDDRVADVTGAGRDANLTVQSGGDTAITAGGLLNLADQGRFSVTGDRVVPGNFVRLTFSFDRGEPVTVDVPVLSSDNPAYADVRLPSGS
jgi:hypothetical protein